MKKPPILIFNPDEMRADAIGPYTPHLLKFIEEDAVSFSRAYCQNPVCVPSRCSFLTGRYPHNAGHRTMSHLLRPGERSLFQELLDGGYHVWMNARNDFAASQIPGWLASHATEIHTRRSRKWPEFHYEFPYSHYIGAIEETWDNDAEDTEAAVQRILQAPDDQPLCIFLGLANPHPPYAAEREYYEKIPESAVPPRILASETEGKCRMMQQIRAGSGLETFTEARWKDLRRTYMAQCLKVDTLFGRLVDALKKAGLYEETAIFVLSDHGDFAGDYDLPEKAQNCLEDVLTRVPLIIKPPRGEAVDRGIAAGPVELVDFYATALDYAGIEPQEDHFGRSLRPVIEDRSVRVRDYACSEGGRLPYEIQCDEFHWIGDVESPYAARLRVQADPQAHEKATMITDGRYKYIERLSGDHEFYDLVEDPGERINLYPQMQDSAEVVRYQRALLHWYQATCDTVPRAYDSR